MSTSRSKLLLLLLELLLPLLLLLLLFFFFYYYYYYYYDDEEEEEEEEGEDEDEDEYCYYYYSSSSCCYCYSTTTASAATATTTPTTAPLACCGCCCYYFLSTLPKCFRGPTLNTTRLAWGGEGPAHKHAPTLCCSSRGPICLEYNIDTEIPPSSPMLWPASSEGTSANLDAFPDIKVSLTPSSGLCSLNST